MTPMLDHIILFGESHLSDGITSLVSKAAAAILKYKSITVAKRIKSDHSPVTAADDAAQSIIMEGLSQLLPGVPVISEEMERRDRPDAMFVLVDPLDGTREYLGGRKEFMVDVELISHGVPIFGCITAPALGIVWRGMVGQSPNGCNCCRVQTQASVTARRSFERGVCRK